MEFNARHFKRTKRIVYFRYQSTNAMIRTYTYQKNIQSHYNIFF